MVNPEAWLAPKMEGDLPEAPTNRSNKTVIRNTKGESTETNAQQLTEDQYPVL